MDKILPLHALRGYSYHAEVSDYGQRCEIFAYHREPDGRMFLQTETYREVLVPADNMAIGAVMPVLSLKPSDATQLMTAMWKAGIRPLPEDIDETDRVAATKYHLEDMRKIAFQYIDDQFKPPHVPPPTEETLRELLTEFGKKILLGDV